MKNKDKKDAKSERRKRQTLLKKAEKLAAEDALLESQGLLGATTSTPNTSNNSSKKITSARGRGRGRRGRGGRKRTSSKFQIFIPSDLFEINQRYQADAEGSDSEDDDDQESVGYSDVTKSTTVSMSEASSLDVTEASSSGTKRKAATKHVYSQRGKMAKSYIE